jgi:hypothetical protein
MLLEALSKMLRKILSLVFNCEKKGSRKTNKTPGTNPGERTTDFITGLDVSGTKKEVEKYPDPWDDPLM